MIYMKPSDYDALAEVAEKSGIGPIGYDCIAIMLATYGMTPERREELVVARNEFCSRELDRPITFREFCRVAFIERATESMAA